MIDILENYIISFNLEELIIGMVLLILFIMSIFMIWILTKSSRIQVAPTPAKITLPKTIHFAEYIDETEGIHKIMRIAIDPTFIEYRDLINNEYEPFSSFEDQNVATEILDIKDKYYDNRLERNYEYRTKEYDGGFTKNKRLIERYSIIYNEWEIEECGSKNKNI